MKNNKRDWQKILLDLASSGYTPWKLSLILGRDFKTVRCWIDGQGEPRHSEGEWLLEVYLEQFGRTANAEKETN